MRNLLVRYLWIKTALKKHEFLRVFYVARVGRKPVFVKTLGEIK